MKYLSSTFYQRGQSDCKLPGVLPSYHLQLCICIGIFYKCCEFYVKPEKLKCTDIFFLTFFFNFFFVLFFLDGGLHLIDECLLMLAFMYESLLILKEYSINYNSYVH